MKCHACDFLAIILLILVGILLIALIITPFQCYGELHTKNICISHGYPGSQYNIASGGYCIKRVNNTDVVVRADLLED